MPLRIDLQSYLDEVSAVAKLSERFLEADGLAAMKQAVDDLSVPVHSGQPKFTWQTKDTLPIRFTSSSTYDGKKAHLPAMRLKFGFVCKFARPQNTPRKGPELRLWSIEMAVTHVRWCEDGGAERMHCHFDLKNTGQYGPEYHFQVAENGPRPAIPRLPVACFLPTDCLDLALSELHPVDWSKHQATMTFQRQILMKAQRARLEHSARDVTRFWDELKGAQTPISALQGYTSKRPFLLPGHK